MKWGTSTRQRHDLSSLRLLGTSASRSTPKRGCGIANGSAAIAPVVDTWWQTETGGIMIAPLPGVTTLARQRDHPLPGISPHR